MAPCAHRARSGTEGAGGHPSAAAVEVPFARGVNGCGTAAAATAAVPMTAKN